GGPFTRNFTETFTKTRMEPEGSKISVWVCREEKLVSGLSRRTTCADVVRVLLEEQSSTQGAAAAMLAGAPQSYCVVEKWRGFERTLPNKTKILRLWNAWGEEQENVRFVLVKSDASLPNNGPRSAEARVVLSKESPCVYRGTARATMAFSQEKQRRIVRKAFRKLDKINKKKEQALTKDTSAVEKMETLVHLVISQDHTIRQQIQRIKELDGEIERYEAKVHFDRIKRHGINYVQDTYMVEQSSEAGPGREGGTPCSAVALEELSNKDTQSVVEELALRVSSAAVVAPPTDADALEVERLSEDELQLEEERVKTQLDASLYIGLRLNTDLETIKDDLDMSQEVWDTKERELTELLQKVGSLDLGEVEPSKDEMVAQTLPSIEQDSGWVEARGLSKTCGGNDDDSDTGLSSMHSQDSDNAHGTGNDI
uniref:Ras-associating domain-containing protein n=1 Tax=Denticeps clupeoides TaxID=299321 RepID=A0AAY4CXK3_9TELE